MELQLTAEFKLDKPQEEKPTKKKVNVIRASLLSAFFSSSSVESRLSRFLYSSGGSFEVLVYSAVHLAPFSLIFFLSFLSSLKQVHRDDLGVAH